MDDINKLIETFKNKSVQEDTDKILLQPFTYIREVSSKNFLMHLSRAFNHWLQISQDKFDLICEILGILDDGTLLIDDIQDSAVIRGGIPSAHLVYGVPCTINAGYFAAFLALEKVHLLNQPEAVKVFTEQLLEMHRGQGMDIYWRDRFILPTEFEYKVMAVRKTALFTMSLRLMQLFSTNKVDFSYLTTTLGLYFTIYDDYGSLCLREYNDKKGFCEDLSEGKFSFPIIHGIRSQKSSDNQVLNILKQRTKDVEVKKYCLDLLEKSGSIKYTRDILESLDTLARKEVARLGANPFMERLLDKLTSWKKPDTNGEQTKL